MWPAGHRSLSTPFVFLLPIPSGTQCQELAPLPFPQGPLKCEGVEPRFAQSGSPTEGSVEQRERTKALEPD